MLLRVFIDANFLVKFCILSLITMSVISWGLTIVMLYTLNPALKKLKQRWSTEASKRNSVPLYSPWISIASHSLQSQLNVITAIAKLSPYVGLLGTVFGIMDALKGLATASSMPIQQLAPGISEALITTALGLLVAIPAMFFHQILSNRMLELEDYLTLEAGRHV